MWGRQPLAAREPRESVTDDLCLGSPLGDPFGGTLRPVGKLTLLHWAYGAVSSALDGELPGMLKHAPATRRVGGDRCETQG